MKKLFLLFLGIVMSVNASQVDTVQPRVLLADLGGIVIDYSTARHAGHLGYGNLLGYLAQLKNPGKLGTIIFKVLNDVDIEKDPTLTPTYNKKGGQLPYLLNAYQAGKITDTQALLLALDAVQKNDEKGYFSSATEKELVKKAITIIFTPELFASTIVSLQPGVDIIKEIAAQENEDGTKKFRLIALSNWDKHSFELVKQKFPELFAHFEKIYLSADWGVLKPDARAFTGVLQESQIAPEDIVFIDDQPENITAAKAAGIQRSILYDDPDMVREQLHEVGMLPKPVKEVPWFLIGTGSLAMFLGYSIFF